MSKDKKVKTKYALEVVIEGEARNTQIPQYVQKVKVGDANKKEIKAWLELTTVHAIQLALPFTKKQGLYLAGLITLSDKPAKVLRMCLVPIPNLDTLVPTPQKVRIEIPAYSFKLLLKEGNNTE